MNKFDEAIEFLKQVEPGSYFDECAELMEELLALAHQPKTLPKVLVSGRGKQSFGAEAWYRRNGQRSLAILDAE